MDDGDYIVEAAGGTALSDFKTETFICDSASGYPAYREPEPEDSDILFVRGVHGGSRSLNNPWMLEGVNWGILSNAKCSVIEIGYDDINGSKEYYTVTNVYMGGQSGDTFMIDAVGGEGGTRVMTFASDTSDGDLTEVASTGTILYVDGLFNEQTGMYVLSRTWNEINDAETAIIKTSDDVMGMKWNSLVTQTQTETDDLDNTTYIVHAISTDRGRYTVDTYTTNDPDAFPVQADHIDNANVALIDIFQNGSDKLEIGAPWSEVNKVDYAVFVKYDSRTGANEYMPLIEVEADESSGKYYVRVERSDELLEFVCNDPDDYPIEDGEEPVMM